jgi:catechol 2,3-dioxygenase
MGTLRTLQPITGTIRESLAIFGGQSLRIAASKVGHLVLRVSNLPRSIAFYENLGLREVARRDFGEGPMAFLSSGNSHHDLALVETDVPRGGALHHFALKVGDSLEALAEVRAALDDLGLTVHMALDHNVSQGLYITDPDENLIELYVDDPQEAWRENTDLVANSDPLML